MDLENVNFKVITNEGAKCGFCNQKLKPIGLDYLYVNYDKDMIEYERCNCEKAVQFWKKFDFEQEEKSARREVSEGDAAQSLPHDGADPLIRGARGGMLYQGYARGQHPSEHRPGGRRGRRVRRHRPAGLFYIHSSWSRSCDRARRGRQARDGGAVRQGDRLLQR